jgi:hypothetical protein
MTPSPLLSLIIFTIIQSTQQKKRKELLQLWNEYPYHRRCMHVCMYMIVYLLPGLNSNRCKALCSRKKDQLCIPNQVEVQINRQTDPKNVNGSNNMLNTGIPSIDWTALIVVILIASSCAPIIGLFS